jgi:hypothetical protein
VGVGHAADGSRRPARGVALIADHASYPQDRRRSLDICGS